MAEDLCRSCVDSCLLKDCAEGNALPLGVTDEISTNLVRHTCDRHGLDSGRLFNELFIGKRQWRVDHSIDGESPLLRVNFWNNECGVDAVKLVVRRDVRRDAIDAVERCSINRCAGGGRWQRLKGLWFSGDCVSAHNLGDSHCPCSTDDRCACNGHKPTSAAERGAWHFDVVVLGVVRMVERHEMAMEQQPNSEPERERNDPNDGVGKWPGDVHSESNEAYRCGEECETST